MKKSKIFMGLAVLLFATGGAIASVINTTTNDYYYMDESNGCTLVTVEIECVLNAPNSCTQDDPLRPGFGQQLYANIDLQTNQCITPLTRQ